ncbi:eukaryotic rRNA processing protein EBP2-domain-containing protein [Halteromyces radiatus]|uniref:eukaryotic rRNA processing protein EBP2-domain-containing protein n=1 Tax=Halteromyces radiatus TaxID=101107 RepID=UPI00221F0680|nr:eukaryotic rRNA processing protein EBP2-domain-containing protein [Halteromyces radiatus]KAI8085061.1 eukaryotic rRNA processing protein EBP2-domain-containing protein [Halteromyces radiatus]
MEICRSFFFSLFPLSTISFTMSGTNTKHNAIFIQPNSVTETLDQDISSDQWLPLEDLNESDIDDDDGDIIIEQRLLVNNQAAIRRLTEQIRLHDYPLIETLSFTSKEPVVLKDVYDDLERETAFEKQALETALMARQICKEANVPFANREDYRDYTKDDTTVKQNNKKNRNMESERLKLMKRKRSDMDADDTIVDNDFDLEDYDDNTIKSKRGMGSLLRQKRPKSVRTKTIGSLELR